MPTTNQEFFYDINGRSIPFKYNDLKSIKRNDKENIYLVETVKEKYQVNLKTYINMANRITEIEKRV